jgi:hypothetical protein
MEATTLMCNVSTEELRERLRADERVIARARARQLGVVRELDRRQTATATGCATLAEWVAGRADVAPEAAQSLVTTARALDSLPHISGALAHGEVTWDRAVELARVATPDDELEVLLDSYDLDIAGLRCLASRRRRVTRSDEQQVFTDRYLTIQPTLDHMAWRLAGQLPSLAGKVVEEALTERADEFPTFPDGTRAPLAHRRADALVAICQGEDAPVPVVTITVNAIGDRETATVTAGPRVGPQTLEAIACDGAVEVTALTTDGAPLGIGRASRTVPARLRRFVLARDQCCVTDGCTSSYRLQAHHRIPWSEGGRTDPDNLVTLCWYHHHVVIHGHGYTIDPQSRPGRIRFRPPPWNPQLE